MRTSRSIPLHPHLQDHRNTLTLFSHFFKAAAAAEAATAAGSEASPERLMLKLSAGALALDFHLHAKARATNSRCSLRLSLQQHAAAMPTCTHVAAATHLPLAPPAAALRRQKSR